MIDELALGNAPQNVVQIAEPFRRDDDIDRPTDDLLRCVPKKLLRGRIPTGDLSSSVLVTMASFAERTTAA